MPTIFSNVEDNVTAVTHGLLTQEQVVEGLKAYHALRLEIDAEWPPIRLKEWRLDKKRKMCELAQKKIADLEVINKDARQAGVPYRERKVKYADRIKELKQAFIDLRAEGIQIAKEHLSASSLFTPSDVDFIKNRGFEAFIRMML